MRTSTFSHNVFFTLTDRNYMIIPTKDFKSQVNHELQSKYHASHELQSKDHASRCVRPRNPMKPLRTDC